MEIPSKIQDEIWDYCRANKITNIDEFTVTLIKQGFTVEKFGATPNVIEKVVEKKVMVSDNKGNKKLTDEITRLTKLDESNVEKLKVANKEIETLNTKIKELTEEKNKNKKDIYGE